MAHFAEIDKKGTVLRVVVTDNNLPNEGKDWLESNLGGTWVQTSYNTKYGVHLLGGEPLRRNFASVGWIYVEKLDAFVPPKPFDSFILNEEKYHWEAPVPKPNDGKQYRWDEETISWIEFQQETN